MKKMTEVVAVVAAVLALATIALLADGTPSPDPKAPTPPPGGYPSVYRLMFATEAGYDADQTDIAWYNTQVNNAANNLGGETGSTVAGLRVTWRCVGSSETVSARVNTKTLKATDPGYDPDWDVPIYNFAGELLAADNSHMWDGSLLEPGYDANGIWDEWSYENGVEPNSGGMGSRTPLIPLPAGRTRGEGLGGASA